MMEKRSKARQIADAFAVYKDYRTWLNMLTDCAPVYFCLILFLVPATRNILQSYSFVAMAIAFFGSNLPPFPGVQMVMSITFVLGVTAGAYMAYATILWSVNMVPVTLFIVFLVSYFTGIGGYGVNNGVVVLFSVGFGLFYITTITVGYKYWNRGYTMEAIDQYTLYFANYLSLNFAVGGVANGLFHLGINLARGNLAKYYAAESMAYALEIMAQLVQVDARFLYEHSPELLNDVSGAKRALRETRNDIAMYGGSAALDELFTCSGQGANIGAAANAVRDLAQFVCSYAGLTAAKDSQQHALNIFESVAETRFFPRFFSTMGLTKPRDMPNLSHLFSAAVGSDDPAFIALREKVVQPIAQYMQACAADARVYPHAVYGDTRVAGLDNAIVALHDLSEKHGGDNRSILASSLRSLQMLCYLLKDFETKFGYFMNREKLPKQPKEKREKVKKPRAGLWLPTTHDMRSLLMRIADFQVSDTSIRCFRFAVGATILIGLAMSPQTYDFFSVYGMTSSLSCYFSIGSQASFSQMIIRWFSRCAFIGIGVAIASLVWLTMSDSFNYYIHIISHILVFTFFGLCPYAFSGSMLSKFVCMQICCGFVVALDQAVMFYHFSGDAKWDKTAYIIGGKYMMVQCFGAATLLLCNLIISPVTTKDVVESMVSDALMCLRNAIAYRANLRSLAINGWDGKEERSAIDFDGAALSSVSLNTSDVDLPKSLAAIASASLASLGAVESTVEINEVAISQMPHWLAEYSRSRVHWNTQMATAFRVTAVLETAAETAKYEGVEPPLHGRFRNTEYFRLFLAVSACNDWSLVLDLVQFLAPDTVQIADPNEETLHYLDIQLLDLLEIAARALQDNVSIPLATLQRCREAMRVVDDLLASKPDNALYRGYAKQLLFVTDMMESVADLKAYRMNPAEQALLTQTKRD